MQKKVKDIIRKHAKKHGISEKVALKIFNMPYRVYKEESGKMYGNYDAKEWPVVRLPFLGIFEVEQKRIDNIMAAVRLKEQKKNEKDE